MSRERVMAALSGGVDSSVAALLLKEAGYEVTGVSMILWSDESDDREMHCEDASSRVSTRHLPIVEQVCDTLGIELQIVNFESEFKRRVIDYFCQEYATGRTPNPCVACNQYLKFGLLLDYAISSGFDYLATGHYARINRDKDRNVYRLLKGVDDTKDQSYMLYILGQDKLKKLLFPLGEYTKSMVRMIAQAHGLPNADRPASQDLCFITTDYRDFLKRYLQPSPGVIVNSRGEVLGTHKGIMYYTIGQRHKLGLATGEPVYVVRIDAKKNVLVVGSEKELYQSKFVVSRINWISGSAPTEPIKVGVKIRYKTPEQQAILYPEGEAATIVFQEAQRAVTPGQAAVFYLGDEVIGGGIIDG